MNLRRFSIPALGFALICVVAGHFSQDAIRGRYHFWTSTAEDLNGPGDNYSYVLYSRALLAGNLNNESVKNWAPAFPAIAAVVTGLSGESGYFAKMFFVSVVFWAIAMTCFFLWVPFVQNPWIRFLWISSIWLLPDLRYWAFGEGYVLSESTSHAVCLIAFAMLGRAIHTRQVLDLCKAALLFGVAANFRAVLDYGFRFASYALVGSLLIYNLYKFIQQSGHADRLSLLEYFRDAYQKPNTDAQKALRIGFVSFLIFQLTTAPWKAMNYVLYKSYAFSVGEAWVDWTLHWTPSENIASWIKVANPGCQADPGLCKIVHASQPAFAPWYSSLSLITLAQHPWAWAVYKLKNFNWIWVGLPWGSYGGSLSHWIEGMGYLLAFGTGYLVLRGQKVLCEPFNRGLLLVTGCLIFAFSGIFAIIHFEHRYSLTIRLYSLVFLATAITSARSGKEAHSL